MREFGFLVLLVAAVATAGAATDKRSDTLTAAEKGLSTIPSCGMGLLWFATTPVRLFPRLDNWLNWTIGMAFSSREIANLDLAMVERANRLGLFRSIYSQRAAYSKFHFESHGLGFLPGSGLGPGIVFQEEFFGLYLYPAADGQSLIVVPNVEVHGPAAFAWKRMKVDFPHAAVEEELLGKYPLQTADISGVGGWFQKSVLTPWKELNGLTDDDLKKQPGLPPVQATYPD